MASKAHSKSNLGFLGEDFQMKLVKCLIEDTDYFQRIQHILDPNMFTNETLRRLVGFQLDRYSSQGMVATYFDLEILCRAKISDAIGLEYALTFLKDIKALSLEGMDIVEEQTEKFFKQQNLIKALNQANDIVKRGNDEDYAKIEGIFAEALKVNFKEELPHELYENVDAALDENFRETITTGSKELDEALAGGLAKGELGVMIAPTGVGKAQPLSARILTTEGFVKMGDIVPHHHLVIGGDGKPHEILNVYPQGKRKIVCVRFSNGCQVRCDWEHLWNISFDGSLCYDVYSTAEIKKYLDEKKHCYVPAVEPINILGHSKTSLAELTDAELDYLESGEYNEEILNRLPQEFNLKVRNKETAIELILTTTPEFRRYYLYQYIQYLTANSEILVENKDKNGEIESYTLTLPQADLTEYLWISIRSLGLNCQKEFNFREDKYTLTFPKLNDRGIYGYEDIEITHIYEVGEEEAQCIWVDFEDHTYVTEDLIVTHNTSLCTGIAASAATCKTQANNFEGYKVLHYYFEDKDVNIERKYYGYHTDIDAMDLSLPKYRNIALQKLQEDSEIKRLLKANIRVQRLENQHVTVSDLERRIKKLISLGFKPDLVILDYFECMQMEALQTGAAKWEKEEVTIKRLEALCYKLNMAFWVPIQGGRNSYEADSVSLSQGGGSIAKVQVAHIVLTLARSPEMIARGMINIRIAKLRGAKMITTEFKGVRFNNGTGKLNFEDCDLENILYDEDNGAPQPRPIAMQTARQFH